jgi:hypothetical protein
MKESIKKGVKVIYRKIATILEILLLGRGTQTKRIIKYLKKIGWKYKLSQEQTGGFVVWHIYYSGSTKKTHEGWTTDRIRCRIKGRSRIYDLSILVNPESIDFVIFNYLEAAAVIYNKDEFLKLLLSYNAYQDNLGSFGYDHGTDSVIFRLTYPSFRGRITFHQFWQCLTNLFVIADMFDSKFLARP